MRNTYVTKAEIVSIPCPQCDKKPGKYCNPSKESNHRRRQLVAQGYSLASAEYLASAPDRWTRQAVYDKKREQEKLACLDVVLDDPPGYRPVQRVPLSAQGRR